MISFSKKTEGTLNTSKVIMEVSKQKTFTYYLPGFMRFNVKNFTSINLQNLDAEMNAAIIFSVYYGALPEHLVNHLLTDIKLNFQRDETIQLAQKQNLNIEVKRVKQAHTIHFYLKKLFHLRIQSQIFWSPFQIIHSIFTITIQSIIVGDTVLQINLMDHPNRIQKLFTSELDTFGNYALAIALTEAQYSNKGVRRAKQFNQLAKYDVKITTEDIVIQIIDTCGDFLIAQNMGCFRHAHFKIPMYKMPIFSLSTIFIPLWLLGIINLGIFFENQDLGNRIQAISGLMVAFVALVPTIRSQIPPHPGWIFIEVLVYLEAATCLLALFHSVDVRETQDFKLNWTVSGYFLVSAGVTIFTLIYVLVMIILHYCLWKPNYTKLQITQEYRKTKIQSLKANLVMTQQKRRKSKIQRSRQNVTNNHNSSIKFIRQEWKNPQCDYCFAQIRKLESDHVFMELQEPDFNTHVNQSLQANYLAPQQRLKAAMKNVSMNVQLDEGQSDSAAGTFNSRHI